eukprot:6167572-Pleurochrysis_carterae.AAC.2
MNVREYESDHQGNGYSIACDTISICAVHVDARLPWDAYDATAASALYPVDQRQNDAQAETHSHEAAVTQIRPCWLPCSSLRAHCRTLRTRVRTYARPDLQCGHSDTLHILDLGLPFCSIAPLRDGTRELRVHHATPTCTMRFYSLIFNTLCTCAGCRRAETLDRAFRGDFPRRGYAVSMCANADGVTDIHGRMSRKQQSEFMEEQTGHASEPVVKVYAVQSSLSLQMPWTTKPQAREAALCPSE